MKKNKFILLLLLTTSSFVNVFSLDAAVYDDENDAGIVFAPEAVNLKDIFIPESLYLKALRNPVFEIVISETGVVDTISVVVGSGCGVLDTAILFTLKKARFVPAKKEGRDVAVQFQWEYVLKKPVNIPQRQQQLTDNKAINDNDTVKQSVQEYTIVIYGDNRNREPSKQTLKKIEVIRYPGYGGDVIKMLEIMPASAQTASIAGLSSTALCIRGSGPDDSKYFIDDIPILRLNHIASIESIFNIEGLKNVHFFPGNFGVRFGGSVSGIIDLETEAETPGKLEGYADISLINGSAVMKLPLFRRSSLFLSLRRTWLGDLIPIFTSDEDYWRLYFGDINAKYSFSINENHKGSLVLLYAYDSNRKIDHPFDDVIYTRVTRDSRIINRYHLNLFQLESDLTKGITNRFKAAFLPNSFRVTCNDTVYSETNSAGYCLREELVLRSRNVEYQVGIDLNIADINRKVMYGYDPYYGRIDTIQFSDFYPINISGTGLNGHYGTYVQAVVSIGNKINLIPGVRFDYYPRLKDFTGNLFPLFCQNQSLVINTRYPVETSARFTAKYLYNERLNIHASAGNFNKDNDPLYAFNNIPVHSSQYSTGIEYTVGKNFSCDIVAYHNRLWDIQEYIITRGTEYLKLSGVRCDGMGKMQGLELFCRYNKADSILAVLSYAFSKSERFDFESDKYIPYEKDRRHNLKLIAGFLLKKGFEVSAGLRFSSGAPKYPTVKEIWYEDKGIFDFIQYRIGNQRFPPYYAIDIKIAQKVWKNRFQWYVDLKNVNALIYPSIEYNWSGMYFDYDEQEWVMGVTEENCVKQIFIPFLGMRVNF